MVTKYTLEVIRLDGSCHVETYHNKEVFGESYAEYCGLGYESLARGRHATVWEKEWDYGSEEDY